MFDTDPQKHNVSPEVLEKLEKALKESVEKTRLKERLYPSTEEVKSNEALRRLYEEHRRAA